MHGPDYELLDAGDGRRLERFGERVVDRPAPGADAALAASRTWAGAHLRYDRHTGWSGEERGPWTIEADGLRLELRPTEAGQVGLFPEHATHWRWLSERAPDADVLHLFAYTGATSLALARAGARVVHVDASRPTIQWARRNATLSDMGAAPIRWIVDDAAGFVAREVRRGRRYDGIVVDPPTYGHGAGGRPWRLDDDLEPVLATVARLQPAWLLLTAHTPAWDGERLRDTLARTFACRAVDAGRHELVAESGARLVLGSYARGIIMP